MMETTFWKHSGGSRKMVSGVLSAVLATLMPTATWALGPNDYIAAVQKLTIEEQSLGTALPKYPACAGKEKEWRAYQDEGDVVVEFSCASPLMQSKNTIATPAAMSDQLKAVTNTLQKQPDLLALGRLQWCGQVAKAHQNFTFADLHMVSLYCAPSYMEKLKKIKLPEGPALAAEDAVEQLRHALAPLVASNPILYLQTMPAMMRMAMEKSLPGQSAEHTDYTRSFLVFQFRFPRGKIESVQFDNAHLVYPQAKQNAKGELKVEELKLPLSLYSEEDDPESVMGQILQGKPLYYMPLLAPQTVQTWFFMTNVR